MAYSTNAQSFAFSALTSDAKAPHILSLWVSFASTVNSQGIFSTASVSTGNGQRLWTDTAGDLHWYVKKDTSTMEYKWSPGFAIDTWYHIFLSRDNNYGAGNYEKLWVDGTLQTATVIADVPPGGKVQGDTFQIGKDSNLDSLNGKIAEIAIWWQSSNVDHEYLAARLSKGWTPPRCDLEFETDSYIELHDGATNVAGNRFYDRIRNEESPAFTGSVVKHPPGVGIQTIFIG